MPANDRAEISSACCANHAWHHRTQPANTLVTIGSIFLRCLHSLQIECRFPFGFNDGVVLVWQSSAAQVQVSKVWLIADAMRARARAGDRTRPDADRIRPEITLIACIGPSSYLGKADSPMCLLQNPLQENASSFSIILHILHLQVRFSFCTSSIYSFRTGLLGELLATIWTSLFIIWRPLCILLSCIGHPFGVVFSSSVHRFAI